MVNFEMKKLWMDVQTRLSFTLASLTMQKSRGRQVEKKMEYLLDIHIQIFRYTDFELEKIVEAFN